MQKKIDKLIDVIIKENLTNILALSDYVAENAEKLQIDKKEMKEVVMQDAEYFYLYFEANRQMSERRMAQEKQEK
ncbi:hypothetical protein [Alkalibacterium olivapovliticus]|uniref:Uncharacterized protein n=1 Tax=Alkalibacterium olivapovliticus TaxID=99907 RepID=A0A2T0VRT5_9LACT|nr:hypothetical protein [Alkalibacterium olivapovliticus]PRY73336.1 hypothetical protein CLV38_1561 [Alkalibacterium olivapovliticus]